MKEEWTAITLPEFLPIYVVSCFGNVSNFQTGREIKKAYHSKGYTQVSLRTKSGHKTIMVHKLVMLHFGKKKPSDIHNANHIDGDKKNPRIDNLEWTTPKENTQHALKNGLHNLYGEKCVTHKLTEEEVREIRAIKDINYSHASKKYGVHRKTIQSVVKRVTWKHI